MEVTEEDSALFRSITEGNLSQDQWEMFKKMQKLNREYVAIASANDTNEDDDELVEQQVEIDDGDIDIEEPSKSARSLLAASKVPSSAEGGPSASTSASTTLDPQIIQRQLQASALTKRYICGEINFTEFTDLVEKSGIDTSEINYESSQQSLSEEEMDDDDDDDEGDEDFVLKPKKKAKTTQKKTPTTPVGATAICTAEEPIKKTFKELSPLKPHTELDLDYQEELKKTKRRNKFRHNRLPRDLQGLVGEANLRFAQGEYEEAIKMCMDVIVLAPLSPEPFQTLGMIYEELGEKEKFLQFSLISAHLSPNDTEEWVRLAEMSVECNNLKQAVTCYSRAIRCDPNNMDLMWARCKLFEQLGETRRLVEQLEQILGMLKEDDGDTYFRVARGLTRVLHDESQLEKATLTMEDAFERHPSCINSEDINFLVELQMKRTLFEKSIKVLVVHCEVKFEPNDVLDTMGDAEILNILKTSTSCHVPESIPIDLTAKLIVSLIRLDVGHLGKHLCRLLFNESAEEIGDLFLDVAEAYMDMSMHADAAPLLETLVKTKKYELAAVWLRYGECLNMLGRMEEAVEAYRQVVQLAPTHLVARMTLSCLLQQLGKTKDALTALEQDEENATAQLEPQLLLHRCNLLYSQGLWDEFLRVSKLLHSSHIKYTTNKEELKELIAPLSSRKFGKITKNMDDDAVSRFASNDVDINELWANYHKMCQKLLDLKRFDELEMMGLLSMTSAIFSRDNLILQECDFLRLLACYFSGNHEYAFRLIRLHLFKNLNRNRIWSLFNQIVSTMKDLRHNRFCLRLMYRHPDHLALGMLNGHNALVSGSYKHALGEYISVLRVNPDDPLVNLCVALIFIHMTCQKFLGKKQTLIVQACVFLNRYLELRGETQESYYNLGRAMHQISFIHAAEHYYLKALECDVPIDEARFDLRSEIAFNLSLIYRASKANHLANIYLEKYCVI